MSDNSNELQFLYNQYKANEYIINHLHIIISELFEMTRNNKKLISQLEKNNIEIQNKINLINKNNSHLITYEWE